MLKMTRVLGLLSSVIVVFGAHAEDCSKLTAMKIPHGTINRAEEVPAAEATRIPYCRVQARSMPTDDSDIRFEVWIPLGSAWNGKFEQVGNGGFAGAIPVSSMAHVLSQGYAVAGTDDGHESTDMTDARWALHHEEKIKDYGWRAISETTRASKQILRNFKSRAPARSYFVGCSDGGREAMMMAQRFPDYFDGIVAGAPAFAMSRLLTGGALRIAQLDSAEGHLSSAKLALLQTSVLKSCGGGAPFLTDPRGCRPDLGSLACHGAETDACLTDRQLETARSMYREQKDPATGGTLYAVLPGAEAVKGSWDAWLTGTDDGGKPAALGFTWNYLANMVMRDPHFDPSKVTNADLMRSELHYAPIMDANDPDLSAFKARGGKLIQYHGWNDPGIPPGYSLEYRERLVAAMGNVEDFYRLYLVPGMLHCGGGDAPTNINWQSAIEAWVEHGEAPGALTARDAQGGTQTVVAIR
jgi:pimeloyl-ACP methyl ester carboxylesterase